MSRRNKPSLVSVHAFLGALRSSLHLFVVVMMGVAALYLTSGCAIVGPNEVAVVFHFGRLQPQVHPSGLLLAFPRPVDEVVKVPVKTAQEASLDLWAANASQNAPLLNPVEQGYSLTGDANIVRVRFILRYQISDPLEYVLSSERRDVLRDATLYACACHVLAGMKVEDALTSQRQALGTEVARLAQDRMNALHLGLHVVAFEVRDISPPQPVLAAFQNVVSAKVQAKTLVEQANAYAATELPAAQAEAFRTQQEADADARQMVTQAQGETTAFLAQLKEYQANPAVMRARLLGEMRQTVLPSARVISVLPEGMDAGKLFLSPGGSP